jgi:hypothetical protein
MVCAPPDTAHCSVMVQPAPPRPEIGIDRRDRLLPLTGLGGWASVAALAGILR